MENEFMNNQPEPEQDGVTNAETDNMPEEESENFAGGFTVDENNTVHETDENTADNSGDDIPQSDTVYGDSGQFQPEAGYTPNYNTVHYSDVAPVYDYKPASKGLKIFAALMAAVIILTGTCLTGYFLGKNSVTPAKGKVTVSLASKPADTDEYTAAKVYELTGKSVVGIRVYNTAGASADASGVIYSKDGYVITNDHIYSEVSSPKFKIYDYDGTEYNAVYVAGDTISDLAVLKIESGEFTPATFGDSSELVCGENVVAIGRPSDATAKSTITSGIISLTDRRMQTTSSYSARLIQTDSAINPGSSGGALINMYGQVVGITSSKIAGEQYDAIGFAIPTTTMKRIVEELIANGKVTNRAKLGISYTAIDSVTAELNEYSDTGLYVASVSEDSDLYGKIDKGDIITHINGNEITDDDMVLNIIEDSVAGDKLTITVISANGTAKDYEVTLKANIGESSYTTDSSKDNNSNKNSSGNSSDGTFNFPFGE